MKPNERQNTRAATSRAVLVGARCARLLILVAVVPVAATPRTVWGQDQDKDGRSTAQLTRLEQIDRRVDEALKVAADVPALLEALRALQEEVVYLRQSAQERATSDRGYLALRSRTDDFEDRLQDLELRLSAILLQRTAVADVDPTRGFVLSSADERFVLRIGGLVQSQFSALIHSEEQSYEGTSFGSDESEFLLRRARLTASGHVAHPVAQYLIALQYGAIERQGLLDAFLDLRFHRMLGLRAGLMKSPYGRQFNLSADSLVFIDRSPATLAFYPGRDVGAMVHGELLPEGTRVGQISYQLGIYNGVEPDSPAADSFRNDNTDFAYVSRLVYEPLGRFGRSEGDRDVVRRPRIALGGTFYFNRAPTDAPRRQGLTDDEAPQRLLDQDGDGELDTVDILGVTAELAAHFRGVFAQSELFYRREDPGQAAEERSFWGAYAQLGMYHRWGLEAAARYSFWQAHRYGEDQSTVAPKETHEVAGALSGFLWSSRVKLQAQYAHQWMRQLQGENPGRENLRAHRIDLFGQVVF